MDILSAIAVALRVSLILIAGAMLVSLRQEIWAVIVRKRGWKVHLSTAIFVAMVVAGAIISSVNVFPDAGLPIPRDVRLGVVNFGLSLFLVGTLTGLYRRALRSGPEQARAAFLTGIAIVAVGCAFVVLLHAAGNHA